MTDPCRVCVEAGGVQRPVEADHLAECPSCRDQLAADEALRGLYLELGRPSLSRGFSRELKVRLARERVRVRARSACLAVMQLYWLVVAVASLWILDRTPWPSGPLSPGQLVAVVTVGVAAVSMGALLLSFRTSMVDLVFGMLDQLGGADVRTDLQ